MEEALKHQGPGVPLDYNSVVNIHLWDPGWIGNNLGWLSEVELVVASVLGEGQHSGYSTASSARPSSTLLIVCNRGRYVSEPDAEKVADIDAHFHSGRNA
ncbi:MAG: hypothetical protein OXI91_00730 [Chloroflexota bacterium]|nr:hypothetical protein [Chloroflexota bacterium]